jgi:hypothetical protein
MWKGLTLTVRLLHAPTLRGSLKTVPNVLTPRSVGVPDFVAGDSVRKNDEDDDDNSLKLCWLFDPSDSEGDAANWKRLRPLGLKYKDARRPRLGQLKLLVAPPVHAFLLGPPLRDDLVQQFLAIPIELAVALLTRPDLATQSWFPIAECAGWAARLQAACALVLAPTALTTLVPDVCTMQTLLAFPPELVPRLNDRVLDLIAGERVLTIDDLLNCLPVLELALSNRWLEAAAEQGTVPEFATLLQVKRKM